MSPGWYLWHPLDLDQSLAHVPHSPSVPLFLLFLPSFPSFYCSRIQINLTLLATCSVTLNAFILFAQPVSPPLEFFSSCKTETLYPVNSSPPLLFRFSVFRIWLLWAPHVIGSDRMDPFRGADCFTWYDSLPSEFTHTCQNLSFLRQNNIPLYVCVPAFGFPLCLLMALWIASPAVAA